MGEENNVTVEGIARCLVSYVFQGKHCLHAYDLNEVKGSVGVNGVEILDIYSIKTDLGGKISFEKVASLDDL